VSNPLLIVGHFLVVWPSDGSGNLCVGLYTQPTSASSHFMASPLRMLVLVNSSGLLPTAHFSHTFVTPLPHTIIVHFLPMKLRLVMTHYAHTLPQVSDYSIAPFCHTLPSHPCVTHPSLTPPPSQIPPSHPFVTPLPHTPLPYTPPPPAAAAHHGVGEPAPCECCQRLNGGGRPSSAGSTAAAGSRTGEGLWDHVSARL